MNAPSTVDELMRWARSRLSPHVDQPQLEARVLLREASGLNDTRLLAFPENPIGPEERSRFMEWVERRALGEPVAYLIGSREFWGLSLKLNEATLIPRPETELLVERALALRDARPARVLDLGTGSGAIALALASERPQWEILATDQSRDALTMAQDNAKRLGLNVRFLQSSWFQGLGEEAPFDLIISNPPYIASADGHLNQGDLRFEPRSALAAGSDGLDDIRLILGEAPRWMRPNSPLLLEHGFEQGAAVRALFFNGPFHSVRTLADLAGQPRISEGFFKT